MRNKTFIITAAAILLLAAAFLIARSYSKYDDSKPLAVVEKVLELRSQTGRESELEKYFTADFANKPKMSDDKINTAVHSLKLISRSDPTVVAMYVQTAGENGAQDNKVAEFYLEKQDNKYLLNNIEVVNRGFSQTIENILPKETGAP